MKMFAQRASKFGRLLPLLITLGVLSLGAGSAMAQTDAPDASSIITAAQTAFYAVGGLVSSIVGFFIIVKVVKWIRK